MPKEYKIKLSKETLQEILQKMESCKHDNIIITVYTFDKLTTVENIDGTFYRGLKAE